MVTIMKLITSKSFLFIACILQLFACSDDAALQKLSLAQVDAWMYQLQDLNDEAKLAALAQTEYPLLVIEPGFNFSEFPYDTAHIMSQLKTTPDGRERVILAYIDIGQAEDYRSYWQTDWVAPTQTTLGSPDYLLAPDPDNWSGNYQVAYWNSAWKNLWLGNSGLIEQIAAYGFDGIYLDWVEAYDDVSVQAAATNEGVDVALEMIQFIEALGAVGKAKRSPFYVVPQNAPYLIDFAPDRYVAAIDALAVEDTWWHGDGDVPWDDPRAGDLHERHSDSGWTTPDRLLQYTVYQEYGLPIFSVDYCISSSNAEQVYRDASAAGLIPLVTRVSLEQLTVTPPSGY